MEAQVAISNADVVRCLERIADLLEIKGENAFKSRAYRQAAASVDNLGSPLQEIAASEAGLRGIDGFGAAIADKVEELLITGQMLYLQALEVEVPPTLLAITELPGVGPKTAALLWHEAGITSLAELEAAVRGEGLSDVPRLGPKTVQKIVDALDNHRVKKTRRPRESVAAIIETLLSSLRALPGVERAEVAGSFRRGRADVADADIVVACSDQDAVLVSFAALPQVELVLLRGGTKCSVHVADGFQIDLRAVPVDSFGAAMQYFTGSVTHNVKLRARALRMGMSLNEYGLHRGTEIIASAEEADVYAALGLNWIAPEAREDNGEIEAAQRDAESANAHVAANVAEEV